jgi:hypothetical protein
MSLAALLYLQAEDPFFDFHIARVREAFAFTYFLESAFL